MANIGDKLARVSDSFTVYRYDNGFMVEIGGRDSAGDWRTSKIVVPTVDALVELVREAVTLPLEE